MKKLLVFLLLPLLLLMTSCETWNDKSKRTCALVAAGQIDDLDAMKRLRMEKIEGKWEDEVTISNYCHYYQ